MTRSTMKQTKNMSVIILFTTITMNLKLYTMRKEEAVD